jgi:hypothetical protein
MSVTSKKWLLVVAVIAVCIVHATLFYFRFHHNTGASVQLLIGTFWAAVVFLCVSLRWLKRSKLHVVIAMFVGGAIILPSAETNISWTLWALMGFVS